MTSDLKIVKLGELLSPHLSADEEITDYRTKPHTAVGENFGSMVITLDVDITNRNTGVKKVLHLVNKTVPRDQLLYDIFNTNVTFFKEMDFYLKAVPAMLKIQQDLGVPEEDLVSHIFPRCFGARHGFGTKPDNDAAILLENLNPKGYSLGAKNGLDLNHSLLVMEKIAYLHALPIAIRKKRPTEYETNIKPAVKYYKMNADNKDKEETDRKFADLTVEVLRMLPIKSDIIEAALRTTQEFGFEVFPEAIEPFVTISHEDLWVNNVLFQADPQNKDLPVALAFVDFQLTRLLSPMLDVVFFLFTSVTPSVRRKHFDQLVDAYCNSFCKCLRQVQCDTTEFTKEAFLSEMNRVAQYSFNEIFSRLRIIEVHKDEMVGVEWFYDKNMGGQSYLKRLTDIVLDFNERGWFKK